MSNQVHTHGNHTVCAEEKKTAVFGSDAKKLKFETGNELKHSNQALLKTKKPGLDDLVSVIDYCLGPDWFLNKLA